MNRSIDDRVGDLRRLLLAARKVYADRSRLAVDIGRATGLTAEGVELGFESLERDATDAELRTLVAASAQVERVHVILSANVFVAPLRALALARAAADRVTIRPSPREPVFTRALVEAARDEAIAIVDERDVARVQADELHVYGRDDSIAAVRARAPLGANVRGHGAGMGVAVVTSHKESWRSAAALAADVVPFDQRGCLSPRLVVIEGDTRRAHTFAEALDEQLDAWGIRVPRGELSAQERSDVIRWRETLAFAGRVWSGEHHTVAVGPADVAPIIPPSGRNIYLLPQRTLEGVGAILAHVAPYVVAVGTDDPGRVARVAPAHARVSALGRMQRPSLDGPVDRRCRSTPRSDALGSILTR
jgi:hypothetical protein